LNRVKRSRGLIGYEDMLSRLRDALETSRGQGLADTIRRQFPVAMIDEFQDTDPVQYRVFDKVYGGREDCHLLMIGDPKQAIYGFRGADVHTYLQARRANAGQLYTLDTNFRSSKGLVRAVNHLFAMRDDSFLYGEIPFHPVRAQGRGEALVLDGGALAPLSLWHLAGEEGEALYRTAYREQMAQCAATEIVRLLNLGAEDRCGFLVDGALRALRPADIAVLVRSGDEATLIGGALRHRGLRSVYLSDKDSVFDSPEAGDLLRWLQAAAEPESEQRIRAALATTTLGLSWAELALLAGDEQCWEREVERFYDYQRQWRQRGVLPMVRSLMHDYGVPRRLLGQGNDRALTNLLHLAELGQRAAAQLDGDMALVRWLADARNADLRAVVGDEQLMRLESDADLLRIVTIHKSKGLEYPLVFLPFASAFRGVDGKQLPLRYHDDDHSVRATFSPGPEDVERADRERLAEDLRLLYVAVTRARHACWIGLAPTRTKSGATSTDLHRSAFGHLLTGGEPLPPAALPERLAQLAAACDSILAQPVPAANDTPFRGPVAVPALQPARRYRGPVAEHWWIASYSALEPMSSTLDADPRDVGDEILAEERHARTPQDGTLAAGIHGFPRGPQPGTFLHGLLEWAGKAGFADTLDEARPGFEDFLRRRLHRAGWPDWHATIQQWFESYLRTPLRFAKHDICLAELRRAACQAELEFWLQCAPVHSDALDRLVRRHVIPGAPRPALRPDMLHGMLKGFIDLVFEHQGRYFVADYKSNWLGPDDHAYSREVLVETMLEQRYDVQLCLYLLALHRLLGARLGGAYDMQRQLGGAALLFLRGIGAESRGVCFQPALPTLVRELDALFRGRDIRSSTGHAS